MKKRLIIGLAILLAVALVFAKVQDYQNKQKLKEAWEDCISKSPVLESNPPQCYDEHGHHWGPPTYKGAF